jgi:hypothetical protein
MLSDFAAFFRVVGPRVPTDVIPTFVDILDRVMVLSNAYVVRALSWVGMISPQCFTLNFGGQVVHHSIWESNFFVVSRQL